MSNGIQAGDTIAVDYTGRLEDGNIFDSSEGRMPLKFTVGAGMLIRGFDAAVMGMKPGETKSVTIAPEDGYGLRNEEAFVTLSRQVIPDDIELAEGMQLQLQDPDGRPIPATVADISDESVKMDINHFLAGKTLIFDITIRETGLEPDAHECGCGSGAHNCGSHSDEGCGCGGSHSHEGGCC